MAFVKKKKKKTDKAFCMLRKTNKQKNKVKSKGKQRNKKYFKICIYQRANFHSI